VSKPDDADWFDKPSNVTLLVRLLVAACAALVAADAFHDRPAHGFEPVGWFAFHAGFGFVACVFLVLSAKELRRLVGRPESYYD